MWEITNINHKWLYKVFIDPTFFSIFVCRPLQLPLWLMFALYVFWGRRSIIDPLICCNFCISGSVHVFEVGFGQSFIFSLHDINLTLGLLPSRRQVIWRDSVGVGSSGLGLKSERVWIFFNRAFYGCYTILVSYNYSETAVFGYNTALFWVLLVSCWCLAKLILT